jgi:hypothetical protein
VRARAYAPALLPMVVGLLLGSPYLAIHLLEERLAPLVELLVIADQLQLLPLGLLRVAVTVVGVDLLLVSVLGHALGVELG